MRNLSRAILPHLSTNNKVQNTKCLLFSSSGKPPPLRIGEICCCFEKAKEKSVYNGDNVVYVVKKLETGVEVKKVDLQGRLILPADWREAEIGENREIYVIKRKGYLKIVPKRRIDLTENFDKVDIGMESIGSWNEFQKKFYEAHP